MPGTLLVLALTVHMLHDKETLKICLIGVQLSTSACLFLQWHLVSFPHQLGGGTYGDKSGPMQNMHPVWKGWICVEGTEDCLVVNNNLHRLTKGDMLRCLAFWRFGESEALYKKTVLWECVCVCVCVSDLNLLPWYINSSHNRTWTCFFSFHNQWCMYVGFLSTLECEVLLWTVCSVSPSLTRSVCWVSFIVGRRLLVQHCWSSIYLLTCTFLS